MNNSSFFVTDWIWHELRQGKDKNKNRLCVIVLCSFSLHILTCVHTGQLLPWQNRGISSYISFGFWYGGKGIQCWSFKLFLTLIICILFDIENVKFSKKLLSPVYYIIYSHLYLYCSARYVFLWIGVRIASNLKYLLCDWNCVSK